ncbi:MAG: nitroreductase family protein [Halobacteriovoraceae bacterium]|nr:nitroreductase family protein [Halobacteriovoraceae bacterium]|tara:strand:- start:13198 stop:13968 length:771 start_codon:yes stop_codon:yes gene_type:complete
MSDLDILTKVPDIDYREAAVEINELEFQKVIESRRSVRVFKEDPLPEKIMRRCLSNALLAPNSSNLQPWGFYWVRDPAKKSELARICMGQSAAKTAPELVVCVAKTNNWKNIQKQMIESFDKKGGVPKGAYTYYQKIVPLAYNQGPLGLFGIVKKILFFFQGLTKVTPREPTSYNDMRVWAHKTTALACENLMLSLRAYGFDSCPMEGHDSKRVKDLLGLGKGDEICMIISAGKRAENGIYSERVRMPEDQFIFEV